MPVLSHFRSRRLRVAMLTSLFVLSAGAVAAGRNGDPVDPLRQDLLGATLAGEFAVQAGHLDEAADRYLDAARLAADDPVLAERAARIALLADDDRRAAQAVALWKRSAPDAVPMLGAEATLSLRRGRVRVARRQLEALLSLPGEAGWRQAFNVIGSGSKDPEQAGRVLEKIVDEAVIPDSLAAWMAFGGLAQRLDRRDLTERILDTIVERFPGEPRVALLRASQLREAGELEQAREVLAPLVDQVAALDALELADIKVEAGTIDVLRIPLAAEYEALGDFSQAEHVLGIGPQDERSYVVRASLLARVDDRAALEALYREVRADSEAPAAARLLLLGQMAEFLEQYSEALDWYGAVPSGEERAQARLRIGRVLHALDRREEAWTRLRELQSDPMLDVDMHRNAYLLEAELRQQDGDPAELDIYNRGLAAMPDDPAVLYSRALMWERRDDIPRAEADLRRILVTDPENIAALNALGYTLADRTTRYAEALELIDRARVAEPGNPAIVDSYGWVLYRLGRHEEALAALRRAYSMMRDAEMAAHIGEVLWMMGRHEEARGFFDEARELDPDSRALVRALEKTGA